jgi:hypothetical protein
MPVQDYLGKILMDGVSTDKSQPGDLEPHWEKQVSVVSTLGGTLRSALAGKAIPAETRETLSDFLKKS